MQGDRVRKPAMRYHGAKFRLAPWVLQHMPPHRCYVEPFGGAAGVLLQKDRAYAEIYNDLDGDVVNFFRVLRDTVQLERLIEACRNTPYARDEFNLAYSEASEPVERARRMAVRAGMGFGSASSTMDNTGFRIDSRRTYGTASHVWVKYPDTLRAVAERFQGVIIENRPADRVMADHDDADTLHFVDPPYLHETRTSAKNHNSIKRYRFEMDDLAHRRLLETLAGLRGMVMLCGYASELYESALPGWHRFTTESRIDAGRGTKVRTEVLWLNAACHAALEEHTYPPILRALG